MKSLLIASTILAGAFTHSVKLEEQLLRDLWDQWKISHQKVYTMSEENDRFNTFAQNYLQILEHNALNDNLTLGLNGFADLTNQEFENKYLGFDVSLHKDTNNVVRLPTSNLPTSVDWREKGAVNEIKNQKNCGSCWSFSAIAALEGLNFIDSGKLESFSEQNLVDCCKGKCLGCKGGLMTAAFEYTSANGIEHESDYPYTAVTGKCAAESNKGKKVNVAYNNVQVGSADELKAAINQQVVSVAVEAGGNAWQFYKGGVVSTGCGDKLNHGIAAVGYGTSKGSDAFIVRNSWGPAWGDSGYIHISTDESANKGHGVCGILLMNSYPTSK